MRRTGRNSALGLVLLCLTACGGLAGDPGIVATLTPANTPQASPALSLATSPTEIAFGQGYPASAPDLANGARIFAERCTACHGPNGDGQGPLVLAGDIGPMASFLDPAVGEKRPQDYFAIITEGNLEKLMPPWREALAEQERWDVAFYVYTLAYTPERVALGATVYETSCQGCHGPNGLGDGPDLVAEGKRAFDLTDRFEIPFIADAHIRISVAEGIGDSMPALADELTTQQMDAVVAYARLLGLSNFQASRQPIAQVNPAETHQGGISIAGQVRNDTTGGTVPADLMLALRFGNLTDGITTRTTSLLPGNTFRFEDVPVNPAYEYIVVALYNERPFVSDLINGASLAPATTLDIIIYERTEDPFSIRLDRVETVIDTFTVGDLGTGLLFEQTLTYTNTSDRVFSTSQPAGSGRYASLLIPLPPGAVILNNPSDPRYLPVQSEFALVDTAPVYPGTHTVQATFFLPYDDGAIIDQALNNPLEGEVIVDILPSRLDLTGDGFISAGTAQAEGRTAQRYTAPLRRNPGQSIIYTLAGSLFASANTSQDSGIITGDILPVVIFVLLGGTALVMGVVLMRARAGSADAAINRLTRQLAELEHLHEGGHINHDAYQRQKQTLRAQLAQVMQSTPPSNEQKEDPT